MSNISQKQNTYLFIDGSNFRQYFNETTQKWFGQQVDFDLQQIKYFFQAEKVFYYDCTDDIKTDNENQQTFDERVEAQEKKLNKIREVEGCHVYLGSLSGKGKKKRQKEVDVLLAVQMMEHAFRGNMRKAVLLSGDKDFRPLVESLVRLGLFIEVVADQHHISTDLIHSADANKKLSIDEYLQFTPINTEKRGLPNYQNLQIFIERYRDDGFFLSKQGKWKDYDVYIFSRNDNSGSWFTTNNVSIHNNTAWVTKDINNILKYFELRFGEIDWK